MTIGLFIKQAIESIWANKMRSFLSLLGIVIGISSFVVMLAIGEGAKASITKDFSANKDIITISQGGSSPYGGPQSSKQTDYNSIFTPNIVSLIPQKVPGVKHVRPVYAAAHMPGSYNDKEIFLPIQPIVSGYIDFLSGSIAYGSLFDQQEYLSGAKHLILGYQTAHEIFKSNNPLGQELRLEGDIFIVVGVLEQKNRQVDAMAFAPLVTIQNKKPTTKITEIKVVAQNPATVQQTKTYLEYYLTKMAGAEKSSEAGFSVRTDEEGLKQINDMMKKFSLLLGGIGAIALVVGGIGIMNIMLVSVTERTREIGIKKAIGATNHMIMLQFLVESIILTLLGSLIAIAFSYGVVIVLGKFMSDFKLVINMMVVVLAVCVATGMGIIFGLMPARKAAKLKVIDALHFE